MCRVEGLQLLLYHQRVGVPDSDLKVLQRSFTRAPKQKSGNMTYDQVRPQCPPPFSLACSSSPVTFACFTTMCLSSCIRSPLCVVCAAAWCTHGVSYAVPFRMWRDCV